MSRPAAADPARGIEARFRLDLGSFALDASFRAPGRGVTALFGPSGAGKTTLLRCLAGLEPAARGALAVNGVRWQDSASGLFVPAHRRRVGYVFQDGGLFPHLSVRRNLRYGARRRPGAAELDEAGVVEWLGLGRLLARRPDGLSGGERQRVALGRALLAGPRLLLMDEPLASLDAASRSEIVPYLERLHRELSVPVLYVSHSRGEVARLADHVLLIEAGRIVAAGPITEIGTRSDVRFGQAEEAGAIADARVLGHDETFGLTRLAIPGGELILPSEGALREGGRVRLRIAARDVSLTRSRPERTSILNVLPARVVEVREAESTLPLVAVDLGGTLILARITRKSAVALELAPGVEVFAQIKGAALLS